MNEQSIKEARQRAASYPYQDGMIEIGHGAIYAILGVLIWVADIVLSGGPAKWLYAIGIILFSLLASAALVVIVKRFKHRVTYPRTGHVKYERPAGEELRDSIILIILSLLVAAGAIFLEGWYASPTVAVGAAITLILYFSGMRVSLTRLKVLAFVPLLVALTASYYGLDVSIGSALAIGGSGLLTLLTGLYVMRSYLAENPAPASDETDS